MERQYLLISIHGKLSLVWARNSAWLGSTDRHCLERGRDCGLYLLELGSSRVTLMSKSSLEGSIFDPPGFHNSLAE